MVSCACASSAKAFGNAARMIAAGLCDAAVVGGADSLCLTTLYGFHSLNLNHKARADRSTCGGMVSRSAKQPVSCCWSGLGPTEADRVHLLGVGESNDAHHMSSPHPEGAGALLAMERALASAATTPSDIDYINLHGTATRIGDSAEDIAVFSLFGEATARGSTKGHTGHTLGAAGIVEAIVSALAIRHNLLPGSPHTETIDPEFRGRYQLTAERARVDRVLSNSFGFGGSNCSLDRVWPHDQRVISRASASRAPGLVGWAAACPVLAGLAPYEPAKFVPQPVTLLPPAERRRAAVATRLAIGVASEALAQRRVVTRQRWRWCSHHLAATAIRCNDILCVLATAGREVSPTRFHNSVHNAPAGYWSVATGSCEPSTSLCAYDASFAAGLVDAAAQVTVDDRPVTLVAYDLPYPEPLHFVSADRGSRRVGAGADT